MKGNNLKNHELEGHIFILEKEYYMFCQIDYGEFNLISLNSGNRYEENYYFKDLNPNQIIHGLIKYENLTNGKYLGKCNVKINEVCIDDCV